MLLKEEQVFLGEETVNAAASKQAIMSTSSSPSLKCNWCPTLIFFNYGERIPRDVKTKQAHNCMFRPISDRKVLCKFCGKEIYFSPHVTSKSGKPIPISVASHGKHRCAARPFNKYTRRRWWEEQIQYYQYHKGCGQQIFRLALRPYREKTADY